MNILARACAALAFLAVGAAPALAQPAPPGCPPGTSPCTAIQGFVPTGDVALSAGTTSSNVALGSTGINLTALVTNPAAGDAYVAFGGSSVVATTTVSATNFLVPAGRSIAVPIGAGTYVAGITASGAAALVIITGTGQPTITWASKSGGGGGSGTVSSGAGPAIAQYPGGTGTAVGPATVSGDCTIAQGGAVTCTKTNGAAFAASATTDATNASNITSGTLNSARLPAGFGGLPVGTLPTVVQSGSDVTGSGAIVLGSAPAQNNLLVAFSVGPGFPSAGTGWTAQQTVSTGTDYGIILTKVAGAGESTTQNPMSGSGTGGSTVLWEVHSSVHTSPTYVTGATQAEFSGQINTDISYPSMPNIIGLSAVVAVSTAFTFEYNVGTQDVLVNSGSRPIVAGHTDPSQTATSGIMVYFSSAASTKGATCLIGS